MQYAMKTYRRYSMYIGSGYILYVPAICYSEIFKYQTHKSIIGNA